MCGRFLMLQAFPRRADNSFGLMAELGGKFPMRRHHIGRRMNLLCGRASNARRFRQLRNPFGLSFQILSNLLAARARCVEIFLRVAFDFWRAAAARGDFVTKLAEPEGQLRLVDGGRELLRRKQALRLQGAILTVVPFRHIEDDSMGMKLRGNITVHRPGGVVLKFRGDKLGRRLRRVVAADTCLRVVLKLLQGATRTLSRCASLTRSSPPTSAVSETDFGAAKVASHPARCSIVLTVFPSASWYS